MIDTDVERVAHALGSDEVAVIPTDTVYGLVADPTSAIAMQKLFELKHRPDGVPMAVLVSSIDQAQDLIETSPVFEALANAYWPGALTIVGHARAKTTLHIGSVSTVGVRLPDHSFVRELTMLFGPIAATSANVHGADTVVTAAAAEAIFGAAVEVIVDGGILQGRASTVVDVLAKVLRQGTVEIDPEFQIGKSATEQASDTDGNTHEAQGNER